MLRLAHRILSHRPELHVALSPFRGHLAQIREYAEVERRAISSAETICIDNVAQHYAEQDRDDWDFESFPNIAPQFPMMFLEWREPDRWLMHGEWVTPDRIGQVGVFIVAADVKDETRNRPDFWFRLMAQQPPSNAEQGILEKIRSACHKSRWVLICSNWAAILGKPENGAPLWCGTRTSLFVDSSGKFVEIFHSGPGSQWYADNGHFRHCDSPLHIACLALSFMHCKNVKRVDRTEEEGPSAKWLRNQKQPRIRYHVLEIDPMKEVLRREGGSETNGLKKALHICRGHFVTYTEDKPLFGKLAGTFWKPSHVRGTVDRGVVDKDYAVKAPK